MRKKYSHPLIILIISFVGIFTLLCLPFQFIYVSLFSLFSILFLERLSFKKIINSLFISLIFALPVVLSNFLFSKETFSLKIIFLLFTKLILLSLLSLIAAQCLDFLKLIYYLMIKKMIRIHFGHILIIAWRSHIGIREEWKRIKLIASLRKIKWTQYHHLIFSLFVFSLRYSQRQALSLIARGTNEDKFFYFSEQYKVTQSHLTFLSLYFLMIFCEIFFLI